MQIPNESAIFLLGKGDRDDECFELVLEHGDLFVMDGNDRESLHCVPRVMSTKIESENSFLANYLSQARINLNLRQVTS